MNPDTYKSMLLLNKVYDYLETIKLETLSMSELKDFLEVVQQGRFLEVGGSNPTSDLEVLDLIERSKQKLMKESLNNPTKVNDSFNLLWLMIIFSMIFNWPQIKPNEQLEEAKRLLKEVKECD